MNLDPQERLQLHADQLIAISLQDRRSREELLMNFVPEVFNDENFLIYKVMHKFKDKGIVPDAEFLTIYLTRNPQILWTNLQNIDPTVFTDTEEDGDEAMIGATINKLERLKREEVEIDQLELIMEKYRVDFKTIHSQRILDTANLILNDKVVEGRRTYSGVEDSFEYYQKKMGELSQLTEYTVGGGIERTHEEGVQEEDEVLKPIKVGDFDRLDSLNEHFGGVYTSNFYNIMAPPKNGKTKLCIRMTHRAKVVYGTNVAWVPIEGGTTRLKAELRAVHFDYYYNQLGGNNYVGLTADMILKDEFPSNEFRELEKISQADFFHNPNYGYLDIDSSPMYLEDLESKLETYITKYKSQMIIVDYLGLITAKGNSRMSKSEIVGEAYKTCLRITKYHNITFISPSQYKQEFIGDVTKGKEVDTRIAGGETSEVIRTPDVHIAMFGSPEDLENNKSALLGIPSRVAGPLPKTDIFIDLGFCYFSDVTWD